MIDGFTLADGVAQRINDGSYSYPVNASVEIPRENDPQSLKVVKCMVIPTSESIANFTRNESDDTFTIGISVQKLLDSGRNFDGEVRGLHVLVQEIRLQVERERVTDANGDTWKCVSMEIDPVFSADHLLEQSLFTSVMNTDWRRV